MKKNRTNMFICGVECLIILATSSCVMSETEGNSTDTPETDTKLYTRENSTDYPRTKNNYSSHVNTTIKSETASNTFKWENFTEHEQLDGNSYNRSNQRIVGGTIVSPNSWPYLVYLEYSDGFSGSSCGGTVYNENYIITAAHCVYGLSYLERRNLRVYAGVHNLRVIGIHEQERSVSNIIIHPGYRASSHSNDIALLKVTVSLDLKGMYVRPLEINIDGSCPLAGSRCQVAGWGTLTEDGYAPDVPYKVDVTVMSNYACNLLSDALFYHNIFDFNICAGDNGRDSCQGDSGGPFVCSCGGRNTLTGIVSWGKGCARPGLPGVYTRVSFYRDWILQGTGSTTTTRSSTTRPTTRPTTRSTTRPTTTIKETYNWMGDDYLGFGSAPRASFTYVNVLLISFCLVGYA